MLTVTAPVKIDIIVISYRPLVVAGPGTVIAFCNGGHIAEFIFYIIKTNLSIYVDQKANVGFSVQLFSTKEL